MSLVDFYTGGGYDEERPRCVAEPAARVLDVGGGTGVHAKWLAEDGYDVTLIDVVPGPCRGRVTACRRSGG